jgi:hypothetical protein
MNTEIEPKYVHRVSGWGEEESDSRTLVISDYGEYIRLDLQSEGTGGTAEALVLWISQEAWKALYVSLWDAGRLLPSPSPVSQKEYACPECGRHFGDRADYADHIQGVETFADDDDLKHCKYCQRFSPRLAFHKGKCPHCLQGYGEYGQ